MPIDAADLKAEAYYWGRRRDRENAEIVQISTVFGEDPEFLTVAVVGSDRHHDLHEFEFLGKSHFQLLSQARWVVNCLGNDGGMREIRSDCASVFETALMTRPASATGSRASSSASAHRARISVETSCPTSRSLQAIFETPRVKPAPKIRRMLAFASYFGNGMSATKRGTIRI